MKVAEIIDAALSAPHGNRQGLSYGQLAVIWLTYMLTQYDHRMNPVERWARERQRALQQATGWQLDDKELTDDRLADLLTALGGSSSSATPSAPHEPIEQALGQHLIRAYELPTTVGRIDTTSVSVYHGAKDRDGNPRTLLHFGHNKDGHPERRQFIEALATLDPVGMPLITAPLPGQQADDPTYLPMWQRMVQTLGRSDFLLVADCKLGSLSNRAQIQAQGGFYLCPLAMVGHREELLRAWVLEPPTEIQEITFDDAHWGRGFEMTLGLWSDEALPNHEGKTRVRWEERALILKTDTLAERQITGLQARLTATETALVKLAQAPGTKRAKLEAKAQQLLHKHRTAEFFKTEVLEEVITVQKQIGRGRPSPKRPTREAEIRRLRLNFSRQEQAIATAKQLAGWRLFVTNATAKQLPLAEAVKHYRGQWQPEHGFQRLKSGVVSALPIYVQDETRIRGLMLVLGIALRVLTLVEFVVRRNLSKEQEGVAGLYDGNPKRLSKRPTTERIFTAFQNLTLYCHHLENQVVYQLTPLSALQKQLLALMGVPETIYRPPEPQASG